MAAKLRFLIPLLIFLIFLNGCTGTQVGTLSVLVLDESTGKPVAEASVEVQGIDANFISAVGRTNNLGVFSVQLDPGKYIGSVSKAGYNDEDLKGISVNANSFTEVTVKLERITDRPVCGNNVCEEGENPDNCPNDCAVFDETRLLRDDLKVITIAVGSTTGIGFIEVIRNNADFRETYNEGESIDGLVGAGELKGQTVSVKVVSVIQSNPNPDFYNAVFELYDSKGNLIDTLSASVGVNLSQEFIFNQPSKFIFEGESLLDLTGVGSLSGQKVSVKFVQLIQSGLKLGNYSGIFELYNREGSLVDTRTVDVGANLNELFLDESQNKALKNSIEIITLALGATTGAGYAEVEVELSPPPEPEWEFFSQVAPGQTITTSSGLQIIINGVETTGGVAQVDFELIYLISDNLTSGETMILREGEARKSENGTTTIFLDQVYVSPDDLLIDFQVVSTQTTIIETTPCVKNNTAKLTIESGRYNVLRQQVDIIPGATYLLTGSIKTKLESGSCQMDVYGGLGSFDTDGTTLVKGVTDWTEYSHEFTVPNNINNVQVRLLQTESNTIGTCWFDDISLTRVNYSKKVNWLPQNIVFP